MTTVPTPAQTTASPSDLRRLFLCMRDAQMACLSGQRSVPHSHFRDDARRGIVGGAPSLGADGRGRDAMVAGARGGDFPGCRSTGRRADLPISCVFGTASGAIASERVFFDIAALREHSGVPVAKLTAGLGSLREQGRTA